MKIVAILEMDRVTLERFEFEVDEADGIAAGAAKAFAHFQEKDLTGPVLHDRVKICFERLDTPE